MWILLAVITAGTADACSLIGPDAWVVDPDAVAGDPPPAPVVGAIDVGRGVGPTRTGLFGSSSTSCDDLGQITLWLDDPPGSTADDYGYVITVLDDGAPAIGTFETREVDSWTESASLTGYWVDGADRRQEPLDFTVLVVAVDRAGVESDETVVNIVDPGTPAGCATAPVHGGWAALLVGLLGLRRRRAR